MTSDDRFGGEDAEIVFANDDTPGGAPRDVGDGSAGHKESAHAFIATDSSCAPGLGRVMLSVDYAALSERLSTDDPRLVRNFAASTGRAANDNVIWVGETDGDGIYGSEASAVTLTNGDTVVAWIGADCIIHARVYEYGDASDGTAPPVMVLKQTLADLGVASSVNPSLSARLKLSALPDSGFVAAWTTEFALATVIVAKAFLPASNADAAEGLPVEGYHAHNLPPVEIPRQTLSFDLRANGPDTIEISYDTAGNGTTALALDAVSINQGPAGGTEVAAWQAIDHGIVHFANDTGDASVAETASTARVHDRHGDGNSEAAVELSSAGAGADTTSNSETPADTTSDVPDDRGIDVIDATDAATDAAIAFAQQKLANAAAHVTLEKGTDPGTAKISVNGTVVTEEALVVDPDDSSLNLAPSATDVSGDTGVAWVELTPGSETSPPSKVLVIDVVTDDGREVGGGPVVIASTDNAGATFSQIDIAASETRHHGDEHGSGAASQSAVGETDAGNGASAKTDNSGSTVAVVWVNNADHDGYGTVSAQLLHVNDDDSNSGGGSVTVIDGNGDEAGTRSDLNCGGSGDVVGRSPDAEGLDDGSLAVAWVERADGRETEVVRAVVLDPDSGHSQELDLSDAMQNGIVTGTSPDLASGPSGDLIVSWLQSVLGGGYEAAAEIFRRVGESWNSSGDVFVLAHFDDVPHDFAIAAVAIAQGGDDDGLSLVLAWHDGNGNVLGTTVDINAAALDNGTCGSGGGGGGDDHGHGGSNSGDHSGSDAGSFAPLVLILGDSADGSTASVIVAETARTDNSGHGSDGDTVQTVAVVLTAVQDAIGLDVASAQTDSSGCAEINLDANSISFTAASSSVSSSNSDGGSANDNTADVNLDCGNSGPSQAELDAVIAALVPMSSNSGSGSGSSGSSGSSGDSGSGSNGSGGGSSGGSGHGDCAAEATNDNLVFFSGYGNDAASILDDDDHSGHDEHTDFDAVACLFDDLQMANALSSLANDDVLTFDADNVATIRSFRDHHGKGDGYFDTA